MTRWLIALGIILLLLCLLLMPFVLRVEYDETRDISSGSCPGFAFRCCGATEKKRSAKRNPVRQSERNRRATAHHVGKAAADVETVSRKLSDLPKSLRWLWKGMSIRGLVIGHVWGGLMPSVRHCLRRDQHAGVSGAGAAEKLSAGARKTNRGAERIRQGKDGLGGARTAAGLSAGSVGCAAESGAFLWRTVKRRTGRFQGRQKTINGGKLSCRKNIRFRISWV